MNVSKCENEHFFDGDKYSECPHCGALAISNTPSAEKSKSTEKRHFFGKQQKGTQVAGMSNSDKTMGKTFGVFNDETETEKKDNQEKEYNNDIGIQSEPSQPKDQKKLVEERVVYNKSSENEQSETSSSESKAQEKERHTGTDSLVDAVKSVASGRTGKTVGFFNSGVSETEAEPVVGWLVCVKGKHFGESFNIAAGRNSIGRGENNKVVIYKDNAVSRDKHAWITYEPKKREFFIQPGESSGLSYLNGDNIMESKKITSYDRLEFGNGIYLFISLCGDQFSWEEYMED